MGRSGRRLARRPGHLEVGNRALDQNGKASDWKAANVTGTVVEVARFLAMPVFSGASYIVGQDPRVDGALSGSV